MRRFNWLFVWWMLTAVTVTTAQGQCATVNVIAFPVDHNAYTIVQDYGARSVRHDGRYHTGQDWALPEGNGLGQPVRAIAAGQVTYANPQGWGRDGGVVILAHTMPDDLTVFSVYGHLMQTESAQFPANGACVQAGAVIGVITSAAPSPHLHFEIRTENGRTPGLGYTETYPDFIGYRRPSQFVHNWQTRLNRNIEWVTTLRDPFPSAPLILSDNSLLLIEDDGNSIARILPDGRRLWRNRLDRPVTAISGFQGNSLLHYADGTVQTITPEGDLGDSWQSNLQSIGAPFTLDNLLVFPTATGLAALSENRRDIVWEAQGIPAFERIQIASQVIGLMTSDDELITVSRSSASILDRAQLRPGAAMSTTPEGTLIVYSQGGLWQILADGNWQLLNENAPQFSNSGGILGFERRETILYDGGSVRNYAPNGTQQWSVQLPDVTGDIEITSFAGDILLYSTGGDMAVINGLGFTCRVKAWGQDTGYLWHRLGEDNVMRLIMGDTFVGIDWDLFRRECI